MAYAIAGVLVVLLVGGFVMFLVLNATRKSGPAADTRGEGPPGIGSDDEPLGDTTQHAGEQSGEGATADDPDQSGFARVEPDDPHIARTGEAEGEQRLQTGTPPDRERGA
jgi:hypothetical protein